MEVGMAKPLEGGGLSFTADLYRGVPAVWIRTYDDEWADQQPTGIGYTLNNAVAPTYREFYERIAKTLDVANNTNSVGSNRRPLPSVHL